MPFSPPTSGLTARYRADTNVTDAGGGRVSAWGDMSGNAYDLAQATSGRRPLLVSSVINGQPILRFDATAASSLGEELTRTATPTITQPFTWVIVLQVNDTGASKWVCRTDSLFAGFLFNSVESLLMFAGSTTSGAAVLTSRFNTIEAFLSGAASDAYINFGPRQINDDAGSNGGTGIVIGGDHGSFNQGFDGDIAEVFLYDHELDATERADLAAYINERYFQAVTDHFNRTDGGLGGNWTTLTNYQAPVIVSNQVKAGAGVNSNHCARWSANSFGDDQYCEVVVTAANNYSGLLLRATNAGTGYMYSVTAGDIYKLNGDGTETLVSSAGSGGGSNSRIRFQVVGNQLTAYVNDVQDVTVSDSTYPTGGSPGLFINDAGADPILDTWMGGPFVAAGGTTIPIFREHYRRMQSQ